MINLSIPRDEQEMKPRITVVGVGGAGGNAVNNMIRSNLIGCEFIVCNTDAQAMQQSLRRSARSSSGIGVTRGLGAGSRPDVGRAAAEEALDEILEALRGLQHGVHHRRHGRRHRHRRARPSSPASPREAGILTIGVVTKPFHFEGTHRMRIAEAGIEELQKFVDTLIIIPNQNLFRVANERTTFADAFKMADDVLHSGVRGVTDLMVMPGPDQSRFRRHPHGDERDGQGDDGHRRGRRRPPRDRRRRGRDLQPAARRCVDEGRQAAS